MGAAFIVRMTDTVESMVVLMKAGRATDGQVLLRSLYEQVVIYCWASIDRETNPERWQVLGRTPGRIPPADAGRHVDHEGPLCGDLSHGQPSGSRGSTALNPYIDYDYPRRVHETPFSRPTVSHPKRRRDVRDSRA